MPPDSPGTHYASGIALGILGINSFAIPLANCEWTSLVAQMVKRLSTMRETQDRSPGWEDPLEKELATHSSTLSWKIPRMEEPGRLQSMGSLQVRHD